LGPGGWLLVVGYNPSTLLHEFKHLLTENGIEFDEKYLLQRTPEFSPFRVADW